MLHYLHRPPCGHPGQRLACGPRSRDAMSALPHPLQLAIGSDAHIVTTMAMLDDHWARYAAEPRVECWLTLPAGPRLLLLTSHTRAHLLYLATDVDLGWHVVGDAPMGLFRRSWNAGSPMANRMRFPGTGPFPASRRGRPPGSLRQRGAGQMACAGMPMEPTISQPGRGDGPRSRGAPGISPSLSHHRYLTRRQRR